MSRLTLFSAISLFLIFIGTMAKDKMDAPKIQKFAHETEKLKPHPKAKFETLKNGFRYVLLPNKTPEKRVMVYLYVNTGSLNEKDHQQGLAHFLEHMAFNGTTNFPENKLIDFFKKIGMNFGGDTNAHTSFDETVYKLNLPEEKYREDAINIMVDYAMNMTLNPEEIEKERGIILSEKRSRDTISYQISIKELKFKLPNVLISERLPIGTEEHIKGVKRKDFEEYYNTWYRPENMTIVVVGDIHTSTWQKSIKKAFKNLQPKAPRQEIYQLKDPAHQGLKISYIYEKEKADTNISISTVAVKEKETLTYKELRKKQMITAAANYIINERLRDRLNQKETPYISASYNSYIWLDQVHFNTISATCQPQNWKASLTILENELRSVLQYGVTDYELSLFKKQFSHQLEVAIESMATTDNTAYMSQIIGSIARVTPFLDAIQQKEIDKPIVEKITKEEILADLKIKWTPTHRLITVSGNIELKTPDDEIKSAFNEAGLKDTPQYENTSLAQFPFEPKPTQKVKIKNKQVFKEFDFTRYTFENNVVLNFKHHTYKNNTVDFNISIGYGASAAPHDKPAITHLAPIALKEGGLTQISKKDLNKALTGHTVGSSFSVEANNFLFQASTTPADFELNLQLIRAQILFAGFRDDATEAMHKAIEKYYDSLSTDIKRHFQNTLLKITTKNDYTRAWPKRENIEAITLNDIKEWLTNQFKDSPIEINVIGNIEEKQAVDLVSTYLGTLAKRKEITPITKRPFSTAVPFQITEDFQTTIKKGLVFIMIPTTDYYNVEDVRYLNILGRVLKDKVYKVVREELAIAYSPSAIHKFSKDFLNACYLQFNADVDLQNVDTYLAAIDTIIKDVLKKGITQDELDNVLKPTLTEIYTHININRYWLDRILSDSTAEPENLGMAATYVAAYENINLQKINEIAKKYLVLEKKSSYVLKAVPPKE